MARGEFFSVGREAFVAACGLGLNPAAVFLVLARGSGRDNAATRWSAEAAADRLGMRWGSAKAAIERLAAARLLRRQKREAGATRPAYVLATKGNPIWLPNALVDGVGDEVPPVRKLREAQDVMALRLLVELYGEQNLREDGGVSPRVVWQAYERERLAEHRGWVLWRFGRSKTWVGWESPATKSHLVEPTPKELKAGVNHGKEFFPRLQLLADLGLVEWVPYLYDGPNGEPMHPLHAASGIPEEAALFAACEDAARRCLGDGQYREATQAGGIVAPVPAHVAQVQLVGVARLRYRPRTALTGAWWAEHAAACRAAAERYAAVG